jgi:hypothetical protein
VARDITGAIARADFAAMRSMLVPTSFICPGPIADGAGGPYPLCDGAIEGEMREGYPVHVLNSDGYHVVADPLREIRVSILEPQLELDNADERAAEHPRILGFHCPIEPSGANCSGGFVLYFEGSLQLWLVPREGRLRIEAMQSGTFAPDQQPFRDGGEFLMAWGQDVTPGRFYPWKPAAAGGAPLAVREAWLLAPSEITGVVVDPPSGACPSTLRISVPEAATVADLKGPEIGEVMIFGGAIGLVESVDDRERARVRVRDLAEVAPHAFELRLDETMLDGGICEHRVLSLVVGALSGPLIGAYRIE